MGTLRKGPSESATSFGVGTQKTGNDGNIWQIVKTLNGTHRWQKKGRHHKVNLKTTKKIKTTSVAQLDKLKKKYSVSTNGSKADIAAGLYRVRGFSMSNTDLELLKPLLQKKQQKLIALQVNKRQEKQITDYKGMWQPKPTNLSTLSRDEIVKRLRSFRNAWEKITKRNADLDDTRLATENIGILKNLLKWYYSDEAKIMAQDRLI